MSSHNQAQIRQKLQQISANDLQGLAEEMACVKFPDRFGARVLQRQGRNDYAQTTKGWPDAFVSTGENELDGIEATRDTKTWAKHLKEDLAKAKDPTRPKLSGFFFVGGFPDRVPERSEIRSWEDSFVEAGIAREKITILVGSDLVLELCHPRYGATLYRVLGIPLALKYLHLMGGRPIHDSKLSLFQPTSKEFKENLVDSPPLIGTITQNLLTGGCALVRGYGAAGKTTLAELVARTDAFAATATYYVDIGPLSDEMPDADLINEMAVQADANVLFILDNIHLNLGLSENVFEHWEKHFKPLKSRLLLLGRQTENANKWNAEGIPNLELRAGVCEMKAVLRRLFAREGRVMPEIPAASLTEWGRTFGGASDPAQMAVDLIGFTAAAAQRIQSLLVGDFRLAAADAVDVIRDKYLKALVDAGELENIVRLSAMAEFEIPLTDKDLPFPARGLQESINKLGLVVRDRLGLERRPCYRLVHAAIGSLLTSAALDAEEIWNERLAAVAVNPTFGRRIIADLRRGKREPNRQLEISDVVNESLKTSSWPTKARTLYELSTLAGLALRDPALSHDEIDSLISSSSAIDQLFQNRPSVRAVGQFLSFADQKHFIRSKAKTDTELEKPGFMNAILSGTPSDLASIVRVASNGKRVLESIDLDRWQQVQLHVPRDYVGNTVSFCLFAEKFGHLDLARAPARRQLEDADPRLWYNNDLSHLSHLLRFAEADPTETKRLLEVLSNSHWILNTHRYGILGNSCGALLSFANYLPPELRPFIVTDELVRRVERELAFPIQDRKKHPSRGVCLVGGYTALGGELASPQTIDWSSTPDAASLFDDVAHSEKGDQVGTYELQLWLGIRALHRIGAAPGLVPASRGEAFLSRLTKGVPPTLQAGMIRSELIEWLIELKEQTWHLGPK